MNFLRVYHRMKPLWFLIGILPVVWTWVLCTQKFPMNFWAIANDSAIMALSHAVNLDDWISGNRPRKIETPQTYHPGLYYQVSSWLVYRLASTDKQADPEMLVEATLRDPTVFWNLLQIIPISITLFSALLFWIFLNTDQKIYFPPLLWSFFLVPIAYRHGTWDLFNESFALVLGSVYFPSIFLIERKIGLLGSRRHVSCGLVGVATGLIYLNKANFILWGIAFLVALVIYDRVCGLKMRSSLLASMVFILTTALTILFIAYLFFGLAGLEKMFIGNWELARGSGSYGSGPKTFVNFKFFMEGARSLCLTEKSLWLFYVLSLAMLGYAVWQKKDQPGWLQKELFMVCFPLAAALLMFMGICKHFVPYYIVAITATFPFLFYLTVLHAKTWQCLILTLCVVWGTWDALAKNLQARKTEFQHQKMIAQDEQEIQKKYPLGPGQTRYWMYRATVPEFQRSFVAEFSGVPEIQKIVQKIQPGEYHFSPWHDMVLKSCQWTKIETVNWSYLVYDKDGDEYINKNFHPWHKNSAFQTSDFRQLIVVHPSSNNKNLRSNDLEKNPLSK